MAANTTLARVRLVLWALVALTAIAATAVYMMRPFERSGGMFGGPFAMQSTQGGTFTQADLVGTPSLMFFGFTYCPDVCPTTMAEANGWKEALGLDEDELNIIFVTVDPERDTVEHLATYLSNFSDDVIGLVGSEQETDQIKAAYGVFSEKVDDPASTEYLVNHTASLFLIDRNGQFVGTIAYGEDSDTALAKVRRLVEG